MPFELLELPLMLPGMALVLFRVMGLFLSAPIFSSTAIPRRAKVGFAFVATLMTYPLVQPTLPSDLTMSQALVGVVSEMMIGLAIGFGLSLIFVATQLGALMIAQQGGLALGQIFNPALNSQTTPLGQLLFLVLTGIFLGMNGHVAVVRSLLESFSFVPPLAFRVTPSVVELITGMVTSSFVTAIRLAGPALTALFLVTLSMGFISRTVPQLNILAVGFSIRSTMALLMTAVSLTVMQDLLVDGVVETMDAVNAILRGVV